MFRCSLIQFIATAEHKSDDTADNEISDQRERVDRSEMDGTATHGEEVLNLMRIKDPELVSHDTRPS